MALSNRAEGGVGVVFGWCRQAQLSGKTLFTGMILQRKAAPDGSRLSPPWLALPGAAALALEMLRG